MENSSGKNRTFLNKYFGLESKEKIMNKSKILPLAFLFATVILHQTDFRLMRDGGSTEILKLIPFSNRYDAWAAEKDKNNSGIQWFKDEMKISPKYVDKQEDVLGMSWAHFLTMLFLVIFFVGALIALYLRTRRTKEILHTLLREEEHEPES